VISLGRPTIPSCGRYPNMPRPREVLPGRTYRITRRCTQRQFLLRPDPETNNAFIYCLAVAAQRADVEVIFTAAQSNHHHTGIYDPKGTYPRITSSHLPPLPLRANLGLAPVEETEQVLLGHFGLASPVFCHPSAVVGRRGNVLDRSTGSRPNS